MSGSQELNAASADSRRGGCTLSAQGRTVFEVGNGGERQREDEWGLKAERHAERGQTVKTLVEGIKQRIGLPCRRETGIGATTEIEAPKEASSRFVLINTATAYYGIGNVFAWAYPNALPHSCLGVHPTLRSLTFTVALTFICITGVLVSHPRFLLSVDVSCVFAMRSNMLLSKLSYSDDTVGRLGTS